MSILLLEVEGWILEVKNHGEGFQVAMIEENQTAHYVRLDREQSETLREFLNEAALLTTDPQALDLDNTT